MQIFWKLFDDCLNANIHFWLFVSARVVNIANVASANDIDNSAFYICIMPSSERHIQKKNDHNPEKQTST